MYIICDINNDKNTDTADFQNAVCPNIKTKIDVDVCLRTGSFICKS